MSEINSPKIYTLRHEASKEGRKKKVNKLDITLLHDFID